MLGTFVIIGDADGRADQLREIAEEGCPQAGASVQRRAPARYEINLQAEVTVVIYNPGRPGQQQVVVNFAWQGRVG